ncbi:hypothetical protein BMS3Bbin02_02215 [bacterium BMS3Bbin02]|nr:hypothetical protein BMS3Bbin02_02215 [bacterium BMS3Bbin02]
MERHAAARDPVWGNVAAKGGGIRATSIDIVFSRSRLSMQAQF